MIHIDSPQYWLTRLCFQRALALIYLIGFLIVVNQFIPLEGKKGLLPAHLYIKRLQFWDSPSVFFLNSSDQSFLTVGWIGVFLSIIALLGISEKFGLGISMLTWTLLWVCYLSFVNVGQVFYGYGWETLLLEVGFLSIFFGSSDVSPPVVIIWLLRWVLFRLMFGAGLIKLRGDPCWRDLTCMVYHYETQPLPNPLSWFFNRQPLWMHKAGVLFTHFVEVIIPFCYFWPPQLRYVAGILTIFFQLSLIFSGNLSWLNYITIVLAIACFDDQLLSRLIHLEAPALRPVEGVYSVYYGAVILISGFLAALSIRPALNLISRNQMMNASFEPLHLVNTYGAFGSITRKRYEVILEGTQDAILTSATHWKEYEFKCKPGSVDRMPGLVSPYHFKIDWQMWFAAMSSAYHHPWIFNLLAKLLQNDRPVLSLLAKNPFPDAPPKFVRAQLYLYQFTTPEDGTRNWWKRTFVSEYIAPVSINNPEFRYLLDRMGWID
jgi:hypothetical protein